MIPAPILVLIVNYRTPALTAQAIQAIATEVKARGDAHILVVDNGSDDGSAVAIEAAIADLGLREYCSLLLLDSNVGFAGGNNAGLDHYRQLAAEADHDRWPDY